KTYVTASIAIAPVEATNNVGQKHTWTVTVKKDIGDGNGLVVAPNGHVDVTLTGSDGITAGDITQFPDESTCDDAGDNLADATGTCTLVFTSPVAGTVTGHAKVTIPKSEFGTQLANDVVRETDGHAPNSGDAIKHFVAGSLRWSKVDN